MSVILALGKWRQDDRNAILGSIGVEASLGLQIKEKLKEKRRNREGEGGGYPKYYRYPPCSVILKCCAFVIHWVVTREFVTNSWCLL